MLTLADASVFFDRTPILDPDTGRFLFYGQVEPFDDSKRDSSTAYRRILSVKPGTVMPAGRVVRILGYAWIVGDSEIDGLGTAHREKFVLHPAKAKMNVSTLTQYLAAVVGSSTYLDASWLKDGKEEAVSSRVVPMFTIFMPTPALVDEYSVVWDAGTAYLTQDPHPVASGVRGVLSLRLAYAPVDATLGTRAYDPVAGEYTASVNSTVKCLRVRWQSLYLYGSQADGRYQEGDDSFVLPAGTVIATKDSLTLAGSTWQILAVENLGGAVVAHGRPT